MPWLNVIDNVAFWLKLQGKPRDERNATATKYLKLLGLEGFEKRAVYEPGRPRKLPIAVRRTRSVRLDSNAVASSLGARGESFAWAPALRNAAGSAGR
jgi:ABC-type Fe3+/spermidine/putrescine transport system ATPase subunit